MTQIKPIGVIHSHYVTKEETPIQGAFQPDGKGWVEVFREYEEALKDIEGFRTSFSSISLTAQDRSSSSVRPFSMIPPTAYSPHAIRVDRTV